ncbi:argininosuccinate synthase [Dissulfurirhabdus thermomarina]|uniref:Argininosuccinate synthase n=1 Tax=Dissulfurirhabdus thermomarina TaxID=1765737 RepID=A0A6N9TN82_DISTH|nr:argininosuccinate synthase [Dissulfurirhabdus thermomarina]NDY42751.1 argininosuccinate synthase [Dissulfurirhabdus thermomarina]NMX22607.1 argininosuccinate synthase [Dissulfurirhabdus thermomarina]
MSASPPLRPKVEKIVLAYSGGLDTSVILKWLAETYECPVVAYSADIGQKEDWAAVERKAWETGADAVVIRDLKEEFVRDFVFPMFRANAIYEGTYLLGTSIARPIIAREQVRVARETGADAVSHGATGKGNDQVRFELGYMALAPDLKIIAPWREWDLNARERLIAYAESRGIPVPVTRARPYSMDANLLHISYEGGILEDPWAEPPDDMFTWTVNPEKAPDRPVYVEIDFERGDPVAVDGERLTPAALLGRLNDIGAAHGVGRVDIVENRFVGMKSRGVYETPGGTLLRAAHMALESITLDREVMHIREGLVPRYSELVYNGFWFSPEREMLQRLVDETQADVTGTVRLKVYKGTCTVVGRKAERSLYRPEFATFEADEVYRQADAEGFIRLQGLRLKIRSLVRGA